VHAGETGFAKQWSKFNATEGHYLSTFLTFFGTPQHRVSACLRMDLRSADRMRPGNAHVTPFRCPIGQALRFCGIVHRSQVMA
jgi:hypothetical protein